jgi:hypothetical protein
MRTISLSRPFGVANSQTFKLPFGSLQNSKSTAEKTNGEKSPKVAIRPLLEHLSGGPARRNSRYMRAFCPVTRRIPKTADSPAERVEFELLGDFVIRQ